jgi:hypothetical protein
MKRKRDKMIQNCNDNKYVNKQIDKKKTGGGPCYKHLWHRQRQSDFLQSDEYDVIILSNLDKNK